MVKIYQVDAFTKTPFGGNPAGVVPEAKNLTEKEMKLIAREMNLSETAFVFQGEEGADFTVRFFTPTEEVDLCGHATVATFHVLKKLGLIQKSQIKQKTKAGILDVQILSDGSIVMDQAKPKYLGEVGHIDSLVEALGISKDTVGVEGVLSAPEIWSTGLPDIIFPVRTIGGLQAINPNMGHLAQLSNELSVTGVHGFTITESGEVWCRNFAPACGIPEESATGTSNGALGACLFKKGWGDTPLLKFTSHQGDWMGRPSRIHVAVNYDKVQVGGHGVITLEGVISRPSDVLKF